MQEFRWCHHVWFFNRLLETDQIWNGIIGLSEVLWFLYFLNSASWLRLLSKAQNTEGCLGNGECINYTVVECRFKVTMVISSIFLHYYIYIMDHYTEVKWWIIILKWSDINSVLASVYNCPYQCQSDSLQYLPSTPSPELSAKRCRWGQHTAGRLAITKTTTTNKQVFMSENDSQQDRKQLHNTIICWGYIPECS